MESWGHVRSRPKDHLSYLRDQPDAQVSPDLRSLPLSLRKTNLAQLLRGRPDGIFVAPFEQGEIGPDLFKAACNM